jgi:hypothetical protein
LLSESQTPLRHVVAVLHVVPLGSPQRVSTLHTPLLHCERFEQGCAFATPHKLSPVSQRPLAQTRAPEPLAPVVHTPPRGALAGMG